MGPREVDSNSGASSERGGVPQIPGYQIEGVVGRGATGVVYAATQLAFDRKVALKVLHPELVGRGRAVRRLQREARLAARLSHANLVSSIDMGESNGRWWHAMEMQSGLSLAAVLARDERMSERRALRLFIPLVEALVHLADNGVVHRDIKPGNILVDESGHACLIDLGLAYAEGDPTMTHPGGTLGTPYYVSPEQARDPTAADERSDLWSLGATLYHSVCGLPPFDGDNVAEILSRVLYGQVIDPREHVPELSKGLALVIRKCLVRDPERRFQRPDELLEQLERLRERRSVRVRARSLDAVHSEPSVWKRTALASTLVLSIVACGWGLRGFWTEGQGKVSPEPRLDLVEPYEPLVLAVARVDTDVSSLGTVLRELEDSVAGVPKVHLDDFHRVQGDLQQRLELEVKRRVAECDLGLRAELENGQYVAGRQRIKGFPELVARDLGLNAEQRGAALDGAAEALLGFGARLDLALSQELESQRSQLSVAFEEDVSQPVRQALEFLGERAPRLSAARSYLALDRKVWLAEHLGSIRMPRMETGLLASYVAGLFDGEERSLEERWRGMDRNLAQALRAHSLRLSQAWEDSTIEWGAVDSSSQGSGNQDFERQLKSRAQKAGEELGQAPLTLAALDEELARLQQVQGDLLERDARAWLAEQESEAESLAQARRFAELAQFWSRRVRHILSEPVLVDLKRLQRSAELREIYLQAAVERVVGLRGRSVELYSGGVVFAGELRTLGDPLQMGFDLVARSEAIGPTRFLLRRPNTANPDSLDSIPRNARVLEAEGIDRLFDLLIADQDELSDSQTLGSALFRFYEGEVEQAAATLERVGEGLSEADAAVMSELWSMIQLARNADADQRKADLERAKQIARTVGRLVNSSHPDDRDEAIELLGQLLGPLAYLDFVEERKQEFRNLRRDLVDPPEKAMRERFEAAFAPDGLALQRGVERVRMEFDFGRSGFQVNESVGTWRRPVDFDVDSFGWKAPWRRDPSLLESISEWPSLRLLRPLDVDSSGVLETTFRVRQLQDSGPPELLLLSVAGWHVALVGQGQDAHAKQARWYVRSGGLDELPRLIEDIAEARGEEFPGLQRDRTYQIRLVLSRNRSHLRLFIDEVLELTPIARLESVFESRRTLLAPGKNKSGTESVFFRSLEPVRLEYVTISGDWTD